MGVGGQRHAAASLPPGKIRYPLCSRLGGHQGRSVRVRKISPAPGFDPRTVQPVASRYTDWAIRAHPVQRVPGANYKAVNLHYLKIKCHCLKYFDISSQRLSNLGFNEIVHKQRDEFLVPSVYENFVNPNWIEFYGILRIHNRWIRIYLHFQPT